MPEASLRVVLDTNVLLVSVSSRSKYHWIFRTLLDGGDAVITAEPEGAWTSAITDAALQ